MKLLFFELFLPPPPSILPVTILLPKGWMKVGVGCRMLLPGLGGPSGSRLSLLKMGGGAFGYVLCHDIGQISEEGL
jgi:hypothetical protein